MIRTVNSILTAWMTEGWFIAWEKACRTSGHIPCWTIIRAAALDYAIPHDPKFHDLYVTTDAEGEDVNFLLTPPRTSEELLRRRECFITGIRSGGGFLVHCMGVDALAACTLAATGWTKP